MNVIRPTTEQQRRQLKAVVRRLLEIAGGVTSFENATRVKAPALSKYASADDSTSHMPLDVAMDLMMDTGSNGILSIMAAQLGMKLVALDADGKGAALPDVSDISGLVRDNSNVISALTSAMADGMITPAEERTISSEIEKNVQELREIQRKAKAAVTGGVE